MLRFYVKQGYASRIPSRYARTLQHCDCFPTRTDRFHTLYNTCNEYCTHCRRSHSFGFPNNQYRQLLSPQLQGIIMIRARHQRSASPRGGEVAFCLFTDCPPRSWIVNFLVPLKATSPPRGEADL